MKSILLNIVFSCIATLTNAQLDQAKYDNSWVFGNLNSSINTVFAFQNDELKVQKSIPKVLSMDFSNSSISNAEGQLQFFSNGVSIATAKGKYLEGGKYISPLTSKTPWFNYGVPSPQQTLVLPWPQHQDKYCIIYSEFLYGKIGSQDFYYSPKVFFSMINMSENAGEGRVVDLDHELVVDTLTAAQLSACKHANGRDYWIFVHKLNTSVYYRLLLSPSGISVEGKQDCGDVFYYPAGQTVFSPDGTMMMRAYTYELGKPSYFDLFDFDRCSGLLSRPRRIVVQDSVVSPVFGGAISANSRFAYISNYKYIFQYDLSAKDIAASKDTVAIYDNFTTPLGALTTFFLAQLAPNGKIYIMCGPNSSEYLHMIDKPDVKGKACKVLQHEVQMPIGSGWTIPNFPNYRLGPLKGSSCDSISVSIKDLSPSNYGLKIFPNPATEQIEIDSTIPNYDPAMKTDLIVVDESGEIVQKYTMPDFAYLATLDISKLASGVYGVQLRQHNKVLAVEKLVVVR